MLVREMQEKAQAYLAAQQVSEASVNAEWILAYVLGCRRPELRARPERALTPKQERHVWNLVTERGRRIPLGYVLGTQDFMGLELRVTPSVLIPRPETEELVQAAVEVARRVPRRASSLMLLDIGTGSGCVSIALAQLLPEAQVVATDISAAALALAEENARKHRLGGRIRFLKADLFHPDRQHSAAGWADVAVSNPPYIPTKQLRTLEPEVLKEPYLALDGGPDGLDAIRAIIEEVPADLKPGGWLVLEIGHDQQSAVRRLLTDAGFRNSDVKRDAQGVPRIAVAQYGVD